MAVITINRDLASGGRRLGRLLSKKLEYDFVKKSLFQKIAEDLNVSERTLESFEKSREYRISNIFAGLFSKNYIQRIVGHDKSVVEEQEYQSSLKNLILEIAKEDNVVIVGRTAYYFLQGMENCYHIRIVASMDWRKNYAAENLGISKRKIESTLNKSDTNQIWFRRLICGENYDSSHFFHLIINMDAVSFEKAVDIAASLVGQ